MLLPLPRLSKSLRSILPRQVITNLCSAPKLKTIARILPLTRVRQRRRRLKKILKRVVLMAAPHQVMTAAQAMTVLPRKRMQPRKLSRMILAALKMIMTQAHLRLKTVTAPPHQEAIRVPKKVVTSPKRRSSKLVNSPRSGLSWLCLASR